MASLITQCPHCRVDHVAMPLMGRWLPEGIGACFAWIAVVCPACGNPSTHRVTHHGSENSVQFETAFNRATNDPHIQLTAAGFAAELWLPPEVRSVPDSLPAPVARALMQAEDNFNRPHCEEPAAVFYGRAIELALKHVHADVGGKLAQRIRKLAADRLIPQAMADWADEVRVVRNDGAHDDGVSREDLIVARDFADAFLRYLISMPAMVERRRNATGAGG